VSYDLMVFDVVQAPTDRQAFMAWFDQQTEWEEEHSYDDPQVSPPALRAWFLEMITKYPALNGPFASSELPEDEDSMGDYTVGRSVIYAGFRWDVAEQAYQDVYKLAAKHGIGFFDVSSDRGEVWLPDGQGGLAVAHSG
jgi:hypothetical protein